MWKTWQERYIAKNVYIWKNENYGNIVSFTMFTVNEKIETVSAIRNDKKIIVLTAEDLPCIYHACTCFFITKILMKQLNCKRALNATVWNSRYFLFLLLFRICPREKQTSKHWVWRKWHLFWHSWCVRCSKSFSLSWIDRDPLVPPHKSLN